MPSLTDPRCKSVWREGARLILAYDPRAFVGVREMIRREQKCCAFLDFELKEDEKELTLAITVPEAARAALDTIFDPFLTGLDPNSGGFGCARAAQ